MTKGRRDGLLPDPDDASDVRFLRLVRWPALAGVAAASVVYLYLGIQPQNPVVFEGVPDYFTHAAAYGLLAILSIVATAGFALRRPALVGAAYAIVHGALLEVVQYFHPPRSAEWHDLASDAVGAMLAAAVWSGASGRLRRRERGGHRVESAGRVESGAGFTPAECGGCGGHFRGGGRSGGREAPRKKGRRGTPSVMEAALPEILIVAGEASGDQHAANLLAAMRRQAPGLAAFGVGGGRLADAGLEKIAGIDELSLMGFAEVARELPRVARLARRVRREAIARRPDVAVLVDAPDFNLRLAPHLRRAGIPVVYFISPQLWAWRSGRVRQIRRNVRKVLCILPFEVPFYARHGVAAEYVGHPVVDEMAPSHVDAGTLDEDTVALLPGSRWSEVDALLPTMLAAARELRGRRPGLQVKLIAAPGLDCERLHDQIGDDANWVEIVAHERMRVLARCGAAVVASGTATLECAYLGVPMVVGYRMHKLTYLLGRLLVHVPHISLVNLVAGSAVVPELIQDAFNPAAVAKLAGGLLGSGGETQRAGLAEVRRKLGAPGASERAAHAVLEVAGSAA